MRMENRIITRLMGLVLIGVVACVHSALALDVSRDDRTEDQEATYSAFTDGYDSTNASWIINGTNFGMGQQILLRNSENGRLWTTFLYATGTQAFDTNNAITANSMSLMDNIGLATNDSALNWNVDVIGDLNGDGQDEAVLTKTSGSQLLKKVLFFSDNGTVASAGTQWQNGAKWVIEGVGLFDTEVHSDISSNQTKQILLRNSENGRFWTTYTGDGGTQYYSTNDFTANTMSLMDNIGLATNDTALNWTVRAIGDVTGNGKDDVVIGKVAGSQLLKKVLFFGDNGTVTSAGTQWQNGSQWVIEGVGRFDTEVHADISTNLTKQLLLRNSDNGRLWTTYVGDGGTQYYSTNDFTANTMSLMDNIGLATNDTALNWVIQGIGDVNNDGKDEVLITKTSGSQLLKKILFFGDNGTVTSAGTQWQNGTKWTVKGMSSGALQP